MTNVADVQCAILVALWDLAGLPGVSPPACLAGSPSKSDVNCDGQPNIVDAQLIVMSVVQLPLSNAIDGDQDGCPDSCQGVPGLDGGAAFAPAWFVGSTSGGGLILRSVAPGSTAVGKAAGGGFVLETQAIGE